MPSFPRPFGEMEKELADIGPLNTDALNEEKQGIFFRRRSSCVQTRTVYTRPVTIVTTRPAFVRTVAPYVVPTYMVPTQPYFQPKPQPSVCPDGSCPQIQPQPQPQPQPQITPVCPDGTCPLTIPSIATPPSRKLVPLDKIFNSIESILG
jgi:hypothetical protein